MRATSPDVRASQRIFFALVPDAAVIRVLAALSADIAHACGGRPPRAQNLHLTVMFLGAVPRASVPVVLDIGARAAETAQPFTLTLDHQGSFRGSDIAWAAAGSIPPALQHVVTTLQKGALAAGLRVERRAFHPHVTLARRCARRLAADAISPIAWKVDALVLMESVTLPGGPSYSEVASWRFPSSDASSG